MYISLELSCKFWKSFRLAFIPLKMYLCLNSCALLAWFLCRVLVLVKVGKTKVFIYQGRYEWGVFTSRFKTDISCLIPSLSWNKKHRSSLSPRRSSFWSLHQAKLEKVFQTKVDKAAVAGSSRGHVSAARTDPSTHDPPDEHHFVSRALLSFSLDPFSTKKRKSQSIRNKDMYVKSRYSVSFLYLY